MKTLLKKSLFLRSFSIFAFVGSLFIFFIPMCSAQVGDFTIYPTYEHGDNTHWLLRNATAGENVTDFVTIENLSDKEEVINLNVIEAYEKDGTFTLEESSSKDLGLWTTLSNSQLILAAHEKKRVTVTIQIPSDTTIGEYTASILASKSIKNGEGQIIVTRLGTRIYLQVQRSYLRANIFTAPYSNQSLLILGIAGVLTMCFIHYRKNTLAAIGVFIIFGSMTSTMTVHAQQLLVQVVGGGYRLSGPNEIHFNPVTASFNQSSSEISVRDIDAGAVLVEDQNGGSEFEVQVQASGPFTKITDPTATIPLSNFLVKNISGSGNNIDTLNGRTDGLTLNPLLNDFYQDPPTNSIANDVSTTRVLATGSGQQPGQWKFYPGFKLIIPQTTAIGVYDTTLVFTII